MSDSTALNGVIETVVDFGQLAITLVCIFGIIKLWTVLENWVEDKDKKH